jgi:hypothetical protein
MKTGYIPDASYNAVFAPSWVEGVPEYQSGWRAALRWGWFGKPLDLSRVRTGERHGIVTYRCTSCGMLESYAPDS